MSHLKSLKRLLSGVIAVIFFTTNTLTPAWATHSGGVENSAVFFPGNAFTIPSEFGKVTDVVKGSDGAPLFIHIEEAHANYAAQTNIKRILQHLTRNYGLDLIFLEGASERLEPELFSFFPDDKKLNAMVIDRLLEAGELTGAEAMLMEAPDKKPRGWGIEDFAAYAENLGDYKEVYQGRKTAENFLDSFYLRWQKSARTKLNKPLREFLESEVAYEEDRLPLQTRLALLKREALNQLQIDLEDVREQKNWPVLVRYFRLQGIDAQIDGDKVAKEQESFLADLAARKIPAAVLDEITQLLNQKTAHGLPLYKTRFAFEKLLDVLPEDYSFEIYPAFRLHLQRLILLSELEGIRFQEEMRMLAQKVVMALAKTEHEKQLTDILHRYRLLRKLFKLELRRSEYQEIRTQKNTPRKLVLDLDLKPSKLSGVTTLYETAIRFYEGAMIRENHMIRNAMVRLKAQKKQKAVLIAGGFHTEGLRKKIVEDGNSYIGITPAIGEISPESNRNYLRALLGSDILKSQIGPEIISQPTFLQNPSEVARRGRLKRIYEIVRQTVGASGRNHQVVELKNKFKRLLGANFFNPGQNFEMDLQRSEMRDGDDQDDEETPEKKKARELSALKRHLQYEPVDSPGYLRARQYLLSLPSAEAIRLLLREDWGDKVEVLADILPEIRKEVGTDKIETDIISEIPKMYPFSEKQAEFFLKRFLSHGAKKKLLGNMADVLKKNKRQDTSTYDAGEVSSENVRLLEKLALCFQKIRPYRFTFRRYEDIFIEYALNRSAPHSLGENAVAFDGLEALGEKSFFSVLGGALTLQDGKFGTGQNFRFIREKLDFHLKKHKNFYYPRLISELSGKRYDEKEIARFLDLYGSWNDVDLQNVFPQSDDFRVAFARLFAFGRPPFTQLIQTPLWAGARGDPDKAQEALMVLNAFTTDFLSRCSSTKLSSPEEKLNWLIQSWNLDRVLSWAQSWKLSKSRNLEPDRRIFETLLDGEGIRAGNYGLVLEKIMKYGDPNLLQETFFFLLATGGRLNRTLPELVKFIVKYPLEATSLIPLLVIHLRFGNGSFSEHTDLKFLSDLLNVRRKSDIFLVRKLVQAFPYPRAMSNIDDIREYVKDLDDQYGLKGFIRYIRMSIHRAPSSANLDMMNAMLKAIGREKLTPFLEYIEPEFRRSLEQESTEQLALLPGWNREIREAAKVSGLNEINTAEDLVTLPDESLKRLIDAISDDGEKGIRRGLILFLQTYNSVKMRYLGGRQKLVVIAPDADQAVEQGRYIQAVELLLGRIANLDKEMDVLKEEEIFERTYATDHSLYEEERWGFELTGYAIVTKERSIAGFEQIEAIRQHAFRLFEDYLEQFTRAHFVDGKEEKGIRTEILKDFDSEQLKTIRMSLRRFLDLLESSGLGNQDFRELGDILEYENLSVAQTLDVFRETGIRLNRVMNMIQILFGGHGRRIAESLGEQNLSVFIQTRGTQVRDKGTGENWAKVAEQKLIGDIFAEEGLILFRNFLRRHQSLLEALKSRTPPLEVPFSRKQSEDVVLFYPGMKPEDGSPKLTSQFGNKGLMLRKMAEKGYPVPPGFTISTDYLAQLSRPEQKGQLRDVVFKYVLLLERQAGRHFPFNLQKLSGSELKQLNESRAGWEPDTKEPLLVSVRSGAFIPLPGVLDTFLKLPVTERVLQLLIDAGVPKRIALDDRRRYLTSYATTVLGFREDFFSRLIENMKIQMGKSQSRVSDFDDASMERIVKGCENEIHNALLNLETIANTPLEGSDWQSRLLNNLNPLRETKGHQAQFHTHTLFGMNYQQFKELILQNTAESKSKVETLLHDLRKRFEQWVAVTRYYDGDEFEILLLAVSEIAQSWHSYRAQEVLEKKGISKAWGTPVTIQRMVHGNRPDSMAFVGQTHDQVRGTLAPSADIKPSGEGEDLVAGRTPNTESFSGSQRASEQKSLWERNPELAQELVEFLKQQSRFGGGARQIEGVVEGGQIYVLQNIGIDLAGSFPGLLPTPKQQPVMRGEGEGGGAKWVRFIFDKDSFSELEAGIKELRKQMDAAGEKDVGIALITMYMTPEEARKVDIEGLVGIVVKVSGGSAHTTIAAREAGKVVITSVSSLEKGTKITNRETGETKYVWLLNGEDLPEGMEGEIYSIDGNVSGPTAGCVFRGKVKIDGESGEKSAKTLNEILRERNQGDSKRAEVRENKNSEIIPNTESVSPLQNNLIGAGLPKFFRENQRRGGGTEKGVRAVTDKITNGIIPLLAHTMNVVEMLIPVIAQIPWVQKIHAGSACRVLGLDSDVGDAFILGSDLALRKGMIEMAKTIFKGSSFAILVKNDTDMVQRAEALIKKEGLEDRVFVITDARLARSRITKPGTVFRGMISSDELMLADELKNEIRDDLIVMDQGMQRRFLNAAGQLFRSLAGEIAAQFLVARSA